MIRVEIVGMGKTVNFFKKVRQNLKKVPNELTNESALALHRRVISNLNQVGPDHNPPGHNTPVSLKKFVYMKAGVNGHIVQVGPTPYDNQFKGGSFALAVEKGTPAHYQEMRGTYHPGAKAKMFWSNAVRDFKVRDRDKIVQKHAERLLR